MRRFAAFTVALLVAVPAGPARRAGAAIRLPGRPRPSPPSRSPGSTATSTSTVFSTSRRGPRRHADHPAHSARPGRRRHPTEQTEIRVLLDGDALYVGARLSDSEPSRVRALLTRRDATSESDRFTVELDSRFDRLTAFVFEVNPRGVRRDGVLQSDGTVDYSPDPVWEAGVRREWLGLVGRDPDSAVAGPVQPRRRHLGCAVHPLYPAPGRGGRLRLRAQDRAREREPVRPAHRTRGPAGHPSPRAVAVRDGTRGVHPSRHSATRSATAATTSPPAAPTSGSAWAAICARRDRQSRISARWRWIRPS